MNYFLVCHRKPIGLWNQKVLKDYASDKHKLYRTVDQTMILRKDIDLSATCHLLLLLGYIELNSWTGLSL